MLLRDSVQIKVSKTETPHLVLHAGPVQRVQGVLFCTAQREKSSGHKSVICSVQLLMAEGSGTQQQSLSLKAEGKDGAASHTAFSMSPKSHQAFQLPAEKNAFPDFIIQTLQMF